MTDKALQALKEPITSYTEKLKLFADAIEVIPKYPHKLIFKDGGYKRNKIWDR